MLRGVVMHGAGRGRSLGFPTANIAVDEPSTVPEDGVYAAWAHVNEQGTMNREHNERYAAAVSVGANVTFDATKRTVEAYLLDFDGDIYGQHLDIEFVARLRPMEKFDSVAALTEQIKKDVDCVRALLLKPPIGGGG